MAAEDAAGSWYVRARGRILGPLSWEQLRALRDRGQLARFDQVSRDKQSWAAADSLERLFPRSGSGGAFVAASGAKNAGTGRGPEPESEGFLILDDDDAVRPATGAGLTTAGPAADEPTAWYYAEAGLPQGPVRYSELKRLAKDGRIGAGTLYWRSGLEQWTSGSDLPELSRLWPYDSDRGSTAGGVTHAPGEKGVEPGRGNMGPRVSPLAIISLASNLLCGPGSLAAIVVGVLALRQIARSKGMVAGKRQAVAGIVLGIVGLVTAVLSYFWYFARAAGS